MLDTQCEVKIAAVPLGAEDLLTMTPYEITAGAYFVNRNLDPRLRGDDRGRGKPVRLPAVAQGGRLAMTGGQ